MTTARERHHLRNQLIGALGDEAGVTMIDVLDQMATKEDLASLATRHDLQELGTRIDARFDREARRVSEEFGSVRGDMASGFGAVQEQFGSVREQFGSVRADMASGFGAVQEQFGSVQEQFGAVHAQFGLLRQDIAALVLSRRTIVLAVVATVAALIAAVAATAAFI